MIAITGTLSKGWMSQALGVAFDRDYYFEPQRRHAIDCLCNEYARKTFLDLALFYGESNLGRACYWSPDQVQIGGIQPNMILGMLLGADFLPAADRDADITPGCLAGRKLAELPAPETLLNHGLVRLFDRQIAQVRQKSEGRLRPIPPFFWDSSGRAAVHGVLTSAQKLCGEAIFLQMLTEPEKCRQIMQWMADAYVVLCRHFAQAADLPITDVHVGECSCCMVSPALVEELVVPITSEIGRTLGPLRLHSCGTSTHLLESFAKVGRLHSLDLGGGTSLRRAREIFGPGLPLSIAPLPQDLSADSAEPLLAWAQRTLAENAGGDLTYVYHLEPGYNVEAIRAWTDLLKQQRDYRESAQLTRFPSSSRWTQGPP
jgi:hypothetical protein